MSRREYDIIIAIKALLETAPALEAIYCTNMSPQAAVIRGINRIISHPGAMIGEGYDHD